MNAHDDYLDLDAAWLEYGRAYAAWGRAVDGKLLANGTIGPPASSAVQRRACTRMVKALRRLHDAASEALNGIARRGWNVPAEPNETRAELRRRMARCDAAEDATRALPAIRNGVTRRPGSVTANERAERLAELRGQRAALRGMLEWTDGRPNA